MVLLTFGAFFFCNDPSPTDISTLSLHDALPISPFTRRLEPDVGRFIAHCRWLVDNHEPAAMGDEATDIDRKSTRLNSSHRTIAYAVFCLKKKKQTKKTKTIITLSL